MNNFFRPSKLWNALYPHFLILVGEDHEACVYAGEHREVLEQYSHQLAIVPQKWLHVTMQGVYHSGDPALCEELLAAAREELRGVAPVTVQLGPSVAGTSAVEVALWPEEKLAEINQHVRAACETVAGVRLRPLPRGGYRPHLTLAYSRTVWDDTELKRDLLATRPARREVTMASVWLVNQRQRADLGWYEWETLGEITLRENR
jgi:2'-5' RNA ligase